MFSSGHAVLGAARRPDPIPYESPTPARQPHSSTSKNGGSPGIGCIACTAEILHTLTDAYSITQIRRHLVGPAHIAQPVGKLLHQATSHVLPGKSPTSISPFPFYTSLAIKTFRLTSSALQCPSFCTPFLRPFPLSAMCSALPIASLPSTQRWRQSCQRILSNLRQSGLGPSPRVVFQESSV